VIAALYVEANGVYSGRADVDAWPESRDARLYAGPWPVVAHPPCQRWSRLAHIHKHKPGKGIGEDGGCFRAALSALCKFGGVLEHPAGSEAWPAFGLTRPAPIGAGWWRTMWDTGWVCEVDQGVYGHVAAKRTWLYYVSRRGVPPMALDWTPAPEPTHRSPGGSCGVELQASSARNATPPAFAEALIALARGAR
jgi:hypothetical protein